MNCCRYEAEKLPGRLRAEGASLRLKLVSVTKTPQPLSQLGAAGVAQVKTHTLGELANPAGLDANAPVQTFPQ